MEKLTGPEQRLFDALVAVAIVGARCPIADQLYLVSSATPVRLARKGYIKIEIYALNWRIIEICHGKHKGCRTLACPHPKAKKPYRTIDESSDRYVKGKIISETVVDGPDEDTRKKAVEARPRPDIDTRLTVGQAADAEAMENALSEEDFQ